MNFYNWLMRFKGTNSIEGDFANDVFSDSQFPKSVDNWGELEKHIRSVNPRNAELESIKKIFDEYLTQQNQ